MPETTETPDALTAALRADRPVLTTITYGGEEFRVIRKPSTLLLAELARTGSGSDEAIGVFADFFESVLGREEYNRFKRAVFTSDADAEEDQDTLLQLIGEVLERTLGRPTK